VWCGQHGEAQKGTVLREAKKGKLGHVRSPTAGRRRTGTVNRSRYRGGKWPKSGEEIKEDFETRDFLMEDAEREHRQTEKRKGKEENPGETNQTDEAGRQISSGKKKARDTESDRGEVTPGTGA